MEPCSDPCTTDRSKNEEASMTSKKATRLSPRCNMAIILLNLSALHIFYISFFVFSAGSVRTIEKRFELRSTQSGLINSVEDIVQTAVVIFPSYLGMRMHKLRLLGGFMTITGVGILLTNIPYALYGAKELLPVVSSGNSNASSQLTLGVCVPGEEFQDAMCDDAERTSNLFAYGIFLLANALAGFGTSGVNPLGTSYIDENSSVEQAPVYLGILQASKGVSPVIGSLLAAVVLRLPENLKDSVVDISSPNWIGAWWLGFAIIGSGIILLSIPLFFTPRHQPYYYTQQTNYPLRPPESTSHRPGSNSPIQSVKNNVKAFWHDTLRLLRNVPFLTITASYVCYLYIIVGIFLNLGRYMEIHFRLSSSYANIISGLSILTGALGTVLGGILMRRYKLTTANAARVFAITCVIAVTGTVINMFVGCDPVNVAGTWDQQTGLMEVNLQCAANCSCTAKFYQPLCVNNQLNYFSPCHAGCLSRDNNQTFADCSCIPDDLPVKTGQCEGPCGTLYIYVAVMAVTTFTSSLGKVPAIMVGLGVMDKDLKSFGLGIQTLLMNVFTFIPGPLIFGALFDLTCIVWKRSCGKSGNCLLYDIVRFRFLMHGLTAGFQMGAAIFAFVTYLLIKDIALNQKPGGDSGNKKCMIIDEKPISNGDYRCEPNGTVIVTKL